MSCPNCRRLQERLKASIAEKEHFIRAYLEAMRDKRDAYDQIERLYVTAKTLSEETVTE